VKRWRTASFAAGSQSLTILDGMCSTGSSVKSIGDVIFPRGVKDSTDEDAVYREIDLGIGWVWGLKIAKLRQEICNLISKMSTRVEYNEQQGRVRLVMRWDEAGQAAESLDGALRVYDCLITQQESHNMNHCC